MGSALLERIKKMLPFWGIPILLVLVGGLVLGLEIGLSEKDDAKATYRTNTPQWYDKVPDGQNSPNGQVQSSLPGPTDTRPEVLYIPWEALWRTTANSSGLGPGGEVPGSNAVFVFKVYGRAHGVGLCMDGVLYRALEGQSYLDIINYYYTGVRIAQVDDSRPVRVKGRDGQVRTMPMKDYLYRLAEEPEDYPPEGLKVLYIAARTYTLSCIARGKHAGQGFDICASGDCCQAFDENKDLSKNPNNVAAVNATSGQALFFNDSPIVAAYCGSCGGHTENNEDVWGGQPLPYLRGKPDTYCSRSPRFCTVKEMSVGELQAKLNSSPSTSISQLRLLDLSDRTPGGRVRTARLVGSSGTKTVPGKTLARVLGFKNTKFEYTFK